MNPVIDSKTGRPAWPAIHDDSAAAIQNRHHSPSAQLSIPARQSPSHSARNQSLADCLDRIRPWERQIFLLSLAIGGNPHLAEKIASETTSRAFSQRHHLDTPDALSASLIRLTIKTGEELAKFDRDDPGIEAPKSSAVDGALAYLGPDGQMTRKAVATAWLTRPQCARLVIVLRDTLHFSTSEIAGILDIPAATVRQLLSSARLGILQLLAPSHFVNTATAIA